jgi:hypothetical protein
MTNDEIEKLRDLASRATKGPWTLGRRSKYKQRIDSPAEGGWWAFCNVIVRMQDAENDSPQGVANAEFIAAANPKSVTELLDEIKRLSGLVDMLSLSIRTPKFGDAVDPMTCTRCSGSLGVRRNGEPCEDPMCPSRLYAWNRNA